MKAIIAGGGTGGHLFPGLAVAREIQRRDARSEILFVGAERGIESRVIPREGFPLRLLAVAGLKGTQGLRFLRNAASMLRAIWEARRILREFRPHVVIGVGGYASFPVLSAAVLSGVPRVIMEQNAMPGVANRVLGRWVDFAAITDPATARFFETAVVTGNPVRPDFKRVEPRRHEAPFSVLVFGGSQGAQTLNRAVLEALPLLVDWKDRLRFVHQAGEAQVEDVRKAYARCGLRAEVEPFFHDFHRRYAEADLILSRAGATTIAEIKAAGRAAILVPFPFAADDHQTRNAEALAAEGAALWIANDKISGEWFAARVRELFSDVTRLEQIEKNAKRLAVLDAESRIVDLAEQAIAKHKK